MTEEMTIALVASYLVSGAIVYSRTYGIKNSVRQILTWAPLLGLVWLYEKGRNLVDDPLIFGLITAPVVVGFCFYVFDVISLRVHEREFYLHAHHSKNMNGLGLPAENKHYRVTDILFSLILILLWIGWPMLFVVLVRLL